MEETKEPKKKRDYLLPVSILVAAVLVAVAIVYAAGKGSAGNNQSANSGTAPSVPTIDFSKFQPVTASDHIVGSVNAPIKIVEFADLECPFCKEFHPVLESISQQYATSVAWVFRNFPLPQLHSKAPHEAQAAECAAHLGGNSVYWKYIDTLYSITPGNNGLDPAELPKIAQEVGLNVDQFNACLSGTYGQDIVQEQSQEAVAIGAIGTPFIMFSLANPLPSSAQNIINAVNAQYAYPGQPPVFSVSPDKKMFSIGGAMPQSVMDQLMNAIVPAES
ncbi:DsbA family protein [Patescibacteria group bacterium]|nr:DsbA family protein [Patescibacteria group bacterium]